MDEKGGRDKDDEIKGKRSKMVNKMKDCEVKKKENYNEEISGVFRTK